MALETNLAVQVLKTGKMTDDQITDQISTVNITINVAYTGLLLVITVFRNDKNNLIKLSEYLPIIYLIVSEWIVSYCERVGVMRTTWR